MDAEKTDIPPKGAKRKEPEIFELPAGAGDKPWEPVRLTKPYGEGKEKAEISTDKADTRHPKSDAAPAGRAEEEGVTQLDGAAVASKTAVKSPSPPPAPEKVARPKVEKPAGPPLTRTERAQLAKGKTDMPSPQPAGTTREKKKLPTLQVYARRLCAEIGPRPTGSGAERQAADFIERVMSAKGAEVSVEPFRTEKSAMPLQVIAGLLPLLAVALFPMSPATGFALITLGFLAMPLQAYRVNVLRLFQEKGESANIVSRILPSEPPDRKVVKVVLLSHYDSPATNQSRLPYAEKIERFFSGWNMAALGLMFMLYTVGLGLSVLKAVHGAQHWIWALSLPLALPSLAALLVMADRWWRGEPSAGANDNASGTAVLLALQRHYWKTPPRHVELWFAATGAGAASSRGVTRLLREHGHELNKAYFINIEEVGRRQLLCLKREGAFIPFSANRKILKKARGIGFNETQFSLKIAGRRVQRHEGIKLLAKRQRAITVTSCPKRKASRSARVRPDEYDGLDVQTLRRSYDFVQALLENIDNSARGA